MPRSEATCFCLDRERPCEMSYTPWSMMVCRLVNCSGQPKRAGFMETSENTLGSVSFLRVSLDRKDHRESFHKMRMSSSQIGTIPLQKRNGDFFRNWKFGAETTDNLTRLNGLNYSEE